MIDGISGVFLPIINVLTASGIFKGIVILLVTIGILAPEGQTHLILGAMSDSLFYFLPILLAFTAAKKFGASPFLAVVVAGVLLYPSITAAMEGGANLEFLGLPVIGVTYPSSVIPILMAVGLLVFVEKFLNKILPELIRGFMTPLLSIFLVGSVTLLVFGPIGAVIGDYLAIGYEFIYHLSPILAGLLLGALIQPMVIFGLQWSIVLVILSNIATTGADTILALVAPAVYAQVGASLAVMLKSKDKKLKSLCLSAAVSSFFGVTEPSLFGINLPRKKPMLAVCIGGGIGGILAGISGAQAVAFAFPSIATFPLYLNHGGFGLFAISCVVGMVVAFFATMLLKFEADI